MSNYPRSDRSSVGDQMEADYRRDQKADTALREIQIACEHLLNDRSFGQRKDASKLAEMRDWAATERDRIVRRWD